MMHRKLILTAAVFGLVGYGVFLRDRGTTAAETGENAQQAPKVIDASQYDTLQAAFDAVPDAGGLVKLPPGEFRISEPLLLTKSETRVVGAGAATKIVNTNTEGKPALMIRPATRDTDRRVRLWRVQLADFRICGDPDAVDAKSTEPKSGDGILAEGIQEIYLHGLSIDHNGGNGVHLVDCYEDPRVSDCIMTYNAQAGLRIVANHDIVVSANQFEENQDAVVCVDSFNLCMNGNNIDDHLRHGVVIENTYGSVLSGNMIEECNGTAVILDRDCYGITISANVIAHDFGGGVDLRHAFGCAVSANTFVLDHEFGLRISKSSGRITVTGNAFSNSHIGGDAETRRKIAEDIAFGIQLEDTSDIVITGNNFTGLQTQAVSTKGDCQRIVFAANGFADLNRSTEGKGAAYDLNAVKDAVVDTNTDD